MDLASLADPRKRKTTSYQQVLETESLAEMIRIRLGTRVSKLSSDVRDMQPTSTTYSRHSLFRRQWSRFRNLAA